ncbi:AraC family transcriptional regulator [Poseidonibacter sp.]|uniref:AraC family transcriptional regulator n=1 Tax=Poseidonibacter sp. TaxID=2321188 RepID=UPI003C78955F
MNTKIINKVNSLIVNEGLTNTFNKNIKLFKTTTFTPRGPLLYDFTLIIVIQGKKIAYLSDKTLQYDANNYLVVPATIPFECETIASKEEPFICMLVSIDKKVMFELIDTLAKKYEENDKSCDCSLAVFSDEVTDEIEDIIYRLLKSLKSKEETQILGEQLLRELYYRIAIGENSTFLHKMFLNTNNEAKISKALKTIHDNFKEHLDIPSLAKEEDMSVSSFHTHFKKVTSHTPLQYIKKIRLNKAKDLITQENYQVNETAYSVGYESISQFSRDFKSYYGYPPKEAKPSFEVYSMN